MKRYIVAGAVALCGPPLLAQELLWEVNTAGIMYAGSASHFGDFNQDGSDDLLSLVYLNPNTQQQTQTLRIQSGVDGSILEAVEELNAQMSALSRSDEVSE